MQYHKSSISIYLVSFTMVLLSISTQAACIATETSASNNSQSNAQSELCSGQAVAGEISSRNDEDWYEFNVASTGTINISLSHSTSDDFDWYLHNSSGSSVASGLTSGVPESGSYSATAGTHYIRVDRYRGTGYYDLNVTFPEGGTNPVPTPDPVPGDSDCNTSESENNNTSGVATHICTDQDIDGDMSSSSDIDWLSFELNNFAELSISISHPSGSDFDWHLYSDPSGSYLTRAYTSSNPDVADYSASAGTYYLKVDSYSGTGSYAVNIDAGGTAPPDPDNGGCTTFTGVSVPNSIDLGTSGSTDDVCTTTSGGFVLMGGGADVDSAIQWMIENSGGGDFVILRSSGSNAYNEYLFSDLGGVNSVQTLLIDSTSDGDNSGVEAIIKNAEGVFIAGGDQQQYEDFFKGRAVGNALNYLVNTKGVTIGGTSAGMAILGEYYHPGGGTETEGLSNPGAPVVNSGFINAGILDDLVTDTHFANRSREPRLIGFMANMVLENTDVTWDSVRGIGCDEEASYAVDSNGNGQVFAWDATDVCYMVRANAAPETLSNGSSLSWYNNQQAFDVSVCSNGDSFNVSSWSGNGCASQSWYVDNGTFGSN